MVVYAGRFFSAKVSCISRMETLPLLHSASMIFNSSFDNLGSLISSPTHVCYTPMYIGDVKHFSDFAPAQSHEAPLQPNSPARNETGPIAKFQVPGQSVCYSSSVIVRIRSGHDAFRTDSEGYCDGHEGQGRIKAERTAHGQVRDPIKGSGENAATGCHGIDPAGADAAEAAQGIHRPVHQRRSPGPGG